MKGGVRSAWRIAVAVLLALGGARLGNAMRTGGNFTTRVTIDGTSYRSEALAARANDSLRVELQRRGVRPPDGVEPGGAAAGHPLYRDPLVVSPERDPAPKVPPGLTPEHAIRLGGDGPAVDLVFGRIAAPADAVTRSLLADGWRSPHDDATSRGPRVFQRIRRKENAVACLDETDRTFLMVRTVDR
jgi:hypothetical protein